MNRPNVIRPYVHLTSLRPVWGMILLLGTLWSAAFQPVAADDANTNTVFLGTWGGSYEKAQREAYLNAFEQATDIKVKTLLYEGGLGLVQDKERQVDVIDMTEPDALAGCQQGLLMPLGVHVLQAANKGQSLEKDFFEGSFAKCSISHIIFSTVIAFSNTTFPGLKPRSLRDFFDVERFPGKRGLQRSPDIILEWALLAEGVPRSQVYDLLSTDRGLRLAFRRLDALRDHIVWWSKPEEPLALLERGDVVMTAAFNGRLFSAQMQAKPLNIIWDGQIIDRSTWVIPSNAKHPQRAKQFIQFVTQPENMATLSEHIPYGPTRHSAMARIGSHREHGVSMLDYLPTSPRHLEKALIKDAKWYANTISLRQRRFDEWLLKNKK